MFTVEGVPEGVPVRLATMDAYDGMVWQVTSGDATDPSLSDSGSFERVGTTMPADFGGETAEVTVVIGEYNDVWVPDVGEVLRLRFEGSAGGAARDRQLNNEFRYNRATDTAASRIRLQAGDRYVMTVRLPTMMPDGLRGQTVELSVPRIGQVSPSVPDLVSKLAGPEILAIKDTAEQLDTVARLMSVEGTYSDGDRGAGQQGSNAGHSVARLNLFVAEYPRLPLIGNAEQYVRVRPSVPRSRPHSHAGRDGLRSVCGLHRWAGRGTRQAGGVMGGSARSWRWLGGHLPHTAPRKHCVVGERPARTRARLPHPEPAASASGRPRVRSGRHQ